MSQEMLTGVIAHDLASNSAQHEHSMSGRRNLVAVVFEHGHTFRPVILKHLVLGRDLDQGTLQRCEEDDGG
jgi:hypothetical protein